MLSRLLFVQKGDLDEVPPIIPKGTGRYVCVGIFQREHGSSVSSQNLERMGSLYCDHESRRARQGKVSKDKGCGNSLILAGTHSGSRC